jgi:hypothetical protein
MPSVDLIVTLFTDAEGQDRFKVDYPLTATELMDVTDQFDMQLCKTDDGRTGFMIVKLPKEDVDVG